MESWAGGSQPQPQPPRGTCAAWGTWEGASVNMSGKVVEMKRTDMPEGVAPAPRSLSSRKLRTREQAGRKVGAGLHRGVHRLRKDARSDQKSCDEEVSTVQTNPCELLIMK